MRRLLPICALVPMIFASQVLIAAEVGGIPVVKPQVKSVAAFKNGLGFVFKSAKTELKDGWVVVEELPTASLGALWIGNMNPTNRIEEVVSFKGKAPGDGDAMNLGDLVEANVGKMVSISFGFGTAPMSEVTGTVLPAPKPSSVVTAQPESAYDSYSGRYVGTADRVRSQIVLLKTEQNNVVAVNKTDIRAVRLLNSTLQTNLERDVNSAKVRVTGNPSSAEITMAYLEKGITWSPSYLVNIKDDKVADLTLEAVLMNDVEDLRDAEVSFVVGYPNFMYANLLSPMLAQQSVASFVKALESGGNTQGSGYGGVMSQSMMYTSNFAAYNSGRSTDYGIDMKAMTGEANEDLFFYRQQHVTLAKGDRARYTIFTSKAPYEHVYVWDVPDRLYIDNYGRRNSPSDAQAKEQFEQVWHTIRLTNNSKVPWTSAPAFTMNGDSPVAQDVLRYAPPTGKSNLKLTVASNVRAQQTQTEVAREPVNINGGSYRKVTVNGVLTIKNYTNETVKMQVTKSLVGEVITAQQSGKTTKVGDILSGVNPKSEILWEFDLKPGEEKKLDYQYSVYVS